MTSELSPIRYRRVLISFISVLLLFLGVADVAMMSYVRNFIYRKEATQNNNSVELIGTLISEPLLTNDFSTVESFIKQWGSIRAEDIYKLKMTLSNGFVIAEYSRQMPTNHRFRFSKDFYYKKDSFVTIEMVRDYAPIEERLDTLNSGIITVSCAFAALLGVFLWITLKRTAMIPLEREIAERKKAEIALGRSYEYFKTVVDSINEAISVIDTRTFRIITANRFMLDEYGLQEAEIVGKTCHEIRYGRTTPCLPHDRSCPLVASLATGEPHTVEQMHTGHDGARKYSDVSVSPIRNEAGEIVRVVHVCRDITDRKHAEESAAEHGRALAKSNMELQQFAYIASHDLQEPLRKVIAFGDRLRDRCGNSLDVQGTDYLARMLNAASRMQVLINDLLTLSRVTSKAQPFVAIDLEQVVREVVSDLEIKIEQTGGEVVLGKLPMIDADPLQMRQLFQNLIGHALKFKKPDTPPHVEIFDATDYGKVTEQEFVELVCTDNGIGFDQKYAERIFEVFQRLHGRSEYEGTGIGLAVCRKIVERHSGDITVESVPGEGARFIVKLPVRHSKGDSGYGVAA